ncbi:hypothetical protein ACVBGC_17925 [Burkholderia stagnalis]
MQIMRRIKRDAGLHADQAGQFEPLQGGRMRRAVRGQDSRPPIDRNAKAAPTRRRRRVVGAKAARCGRGRPDRSGWPTSRIDIGAAEKYRRQRKKWGSDVLRTRHRFLFVAQVVRPRRLWRSDYKKAFSALQTYFGPAGHPGAWLPDDIGGRSARRSRPDDQTRTKPRINRAPESLGAAPVRPCTGSGKQCGFYGRSSQGPAAAINLD